MSLPPTKMHWLGFYPMFSMKLVMWAPFYCREYSQHFTPMSTCVRCSSVVCSAMLRAHAHRPRTSAVRTSDIACISTLQQRCFAYRRDLVGLILVKDLVLVDMHAGTKVSNIRIRNLPFLRADTPMYDLLKVFQTGRSHMLVLTRHPDMDEDLLANPPASPHANGNHPLPSQVSHAVLIIPSTCLSQCPCTRQSMADSAWGSPHCGA